MNSRPPENLIRHPIADPGEALLQEEQGFDRRPAVSPNELLEPAPSETGRVNLGSDRLPPWRRIFPMLKTHPAELPGVAKD